MAQQNPISTQQESKRLFNNPILHRLSRTHISVPLVMYYGLSIFLLYYGAVNTSLNILSLVGFFAVGFFFFTLIEYLMHRYMFHMLPTNKIKKWVQYNFHGVHHDFPKDKSRLAMPPLASITIAAILYFAFTLLLGDYTFGFLPGFLSGYASYLAVHYIVHAFRPPNNVFKTLWVHHGIHHYKDDEVAFGVSSPLWDWIFRTMPKK